MKPILPLLCFAGLMMLGCGDGNRNRPIALHPDNPHYFLYRGQPVVLITSGEHYGAVLNLDFDFSTYLNTLAADGMNLTRVFTGAYVEPAGAFKIEENTLAPAQGRYLCPWPRSAIPGYANGGNKFDLSGWDEAYFTRLKEFMSEAEKRNIVVELTLFCPFYGDHQWNLSPMNPVNNINGIGTDNREHVYTLDRSDGLLAVQEKLVRKLVAELSGYSNLIWEICNEPYFGGVTAEWQHHIAELIRESEKELDHPHLISQNIANGSQKIRGPHPAVSVFNFHYATPPLAVGQNYHLNKAIGDNETGFRGNADSTYRKEGWSFILAGGALYNNLDYSFTARHEDGSFQYPNTQPGGGSSTLRKQLGHLQRYISGFDYVRMTPDSTLVMGNTGPRRAWVLSEPGRQYALYLFGPGPHRLTLSLPAGTYEVEYTDPLTGETQKGDDIRSEGRADIQTPPYREDVAIKISAIATAQ